MPLETMRVSGVKNVDFFEDFAYALMIELLRDFSIFNLSLLFQYKSKIKSDLKYKLFMITHQRFEI